MFCKQVIFGGLQAAGLEEKQNTHGIVYIGGLQYGPMWRRGHSVELVSAGKTLT